ncbi:MAG: hypothetical protein HJJLKODD_00109 [Phycisphaerae bacterium]|nr:hypothetical protein [Phycisphaerae bacterium]
MTSDSLQLGHAAEQAAAQFLRAAGQRIIACNYRCPLGEIDLISLDRDTLCFIEVKASRGPACHPEDRVNATKQRQIRKVAQAFLARYPRYQSTPLRFDVVAVEFDECKQPHITYYPDAF